MRPGDFACLPPGGAYQPWLCDHPDVHYAEQGWCCASCGTGVRLVGGSATRFPDFVFDEARGPAPRCDGTADLFGVGAPRRGGGEGDEHGTG